MVRPGEAAQRRDAAWSGWRSASRCAGGECIEVERACGRVLFRNSTEPDIHVVVSETDWQAFIASVKAGEFDDPAAVQG